MFCISHFYIIAWFIMANILCHAWLCTQKAYMVMWSQCDVDIDRATTKKRYSPRTHFTLVSGDRQPTKRNERASTMLTVVVTTLIACAMGCTALGSEVQSGVRGKNGIYGGEASFGFTNKVEGGGRFSGIDGYVGDADHFGVFSFFLYTLDQWSIR